MAGSKLVIYNTAGHCYWKNQFKATLAMLSFLALFRPVQPLPYLTTVFRPLNHLILLYAQFGPNLCTHKESDTEATMKLLQN